MGYKKYNEQAKSAVIDGVKQYELVILFVEYPFLNHPPLQEEQ
jgi:hypothetical protein